MLFSRKRYDSGLHTSELGSLTYAVKQVIRDVGLDALIQELVANAANDEP